MDDIIINLSTKGVILNFAPCVQPPVRRQLTSKFLDMGRTRPTHSEIVNIGENIAETVRKVRTAFGHRCRMILTDFFLPEIDAMDGCWQRLFSAGRRHSL